MLNRVPGTQSYVNYLKTIGEKPLYITKKCHTVRRLNRSRQISMQLTTSYLDSWSTLSYTTMRKINYKDTPFKWSNLTTIRVELTFETLHNLWNKIKENTKSVYSNLGGGAHVHLGLLLTDAQYALIYPTTFVYPTFPGPLIIPYGTTSHVNSNMPIAHTKEVRMFREVTGVEQSLVQKIVGTVEEAYLADICNRTKNLIAYICTTGWRWTISRRCDAKDKNRSIPRLVDGEVPRMVLLSSYW